MSQTLYDVLLKVDFTQIDGATVSVKKLNDANNDAAKGMKAVSEAASDAVEPLKKVASAHAGVNRELIVLGHEAMVGNWSRFGGSMLVLGERTNALGAIFGALATPVGAAAVAIVGAIAAVGVAFVQAHKEAKEFASALYLTNNYAGLTTSSMHSLADTLSNEVNSSYGTAFHAVLNLAKAGQYTKEQLALLAPIVINDSRMSGIAIDKVADSYANLARSPTKFMEAFNESHHVFTPKQQEQIRLLEETGRSQEAVTLALKSYTEYQKGPGKKAIEENLSLMDKEIIGLGLMWDAFKRFTGAEKVTPMDQLKELNKEIDTLQAKVGDLSKHSAHSMAMPGDVSDLKNLLDKRKKLMLEIAKDDKENRERANDSLKSQLYQEGSDYLTGLGVKGARSLKIELEKFDKEVKNIRLSNPDSDLLDPEYLKAARQKVIDANTPKRKDPKEIHMAQVDKPASDPYEVWNKSLEKLLDNAEHFSELKKAQIELAHIDEEVATKNAQIDKENAARKEFNEANAVRIARGLTDAKIMLNKLDTDSIDIQAKKTEGLRLAEQADITKSLDLQKTQYAGLDAIVQKYNDTITKQIEIKHKSAEAIADEAAKQKIQEQYEKDLLELKKKEVASGSEQILQAMQIQQLDEKRAASIKAITDQTKRATDAQSNFIQNGVNGMLTSLPTLEKGLETITTKGLQGFSDTLYTLVTTGKNGFASMVASMLDQLAKLIFQLGVVKPMLDSMQASMSSGGVSGSILGFLSSIGVGRSGGAAPASSGTQIAGDVVTAAADGADIGMPNSGKSILVGEKGPEMFIPKSTGTIIPNNKLNIGGGGGATQNLNFTHNITVQSTNGNMADTLEQGRQIQQMVDKQIKMTIARESMPGGSLSAAQRRY